MNKNYYGKLLSSPLQNFKAKKNLDLLVHSYFLSLAHSDTSGYNVCPLANRVTREEKHPEKSNCSAVCVAENGKGKFPNVKKARIRKTKMFFENRDKFVELLYLDVKKAIEFSEFYGFIPTFRLNAYSDINWEKIIIKDNKNIFELFPSITFYDYTKIPNRKTPRNYELTYSHWGKWETTNKKLKKGHNVAMVFNKNNKLPDIFQNKKVVNGDKTDLRTKENDGNGVIVGLLAKMSKEKIENELKKDVSFIVKS